MLIELSFFIDILKLFIENMIYIDCAVQFSYFTRNF